MKILVVDDEEYVRDLIKTYLKDTDHELREAGDGEEALELFRADPADVVVTDNAMPRMTGTEMVKHLRRESPGVKILAMSGLSLSPEARESVDVVIQKPFVRREFLEALGKLLDS